MRWRLRAGWSPFHLHRAFRRIVGETPKQYTLRLRLEGAAARMLASDDSIVDVALAAGFNSHEVFTRAFRRHFGRTPAEYRANALAGASAEVRARHRLITDTTGPCVGLFHLSVNHPHPIRRSSMPTLSIERRELTPQPVLIIRCRTPRSDLQMAIGNSLGGVFGHCQKVGLPLEGKPFTRYLSTGPGLLTSNAASRSPRQRPARVRSKPRRCQVGPSCYGRARRSLRQLNETYVAMERWMEPTAFGRRGAVGVLHHRPGGLSESC